VLLGASNLTRAFPHVVACVRAALPGPVDVLAAIGKGRSYGRTSRFLARKLPGILECGLWRALDERPGPETRALLGDLGNDLVYGAEVDEIAAWIGTILDRLRAHGSRCALVRLPLGNLDRISPLRFRLARSLFYPGRAADLGELRRRAIDLDARVVEIARSRGVALVEQDVGWYGLDPIHVLRARRPEVCAAWLSPIGAHPSNGSVKMAAGERAAIRGARAERRRVLGVLRTRPPPSARLLDGTTISVY